MHPDEQVVQDVLTEILLGPEEFLTHLIADTGTLINAIQFTSNLRSYPTVGLPRYHMPTKFVPLDGLLYFSGASKKHGRARVSQLAAKKGTCETQ